MSDLATRRARFVHESMRLAAFAAGTASAPLPWDVCTWTFRIRMQALIARQCGPDRSSSPEEVHADWVRAYEAMGWTHGPERDTERKTHPSMVPYDDLSQPERDKDAVFMAMCDIARRYIT